jgi:uncharacterized RDD family membrane protein YckC
MNCPLCGNAYPCAHSRKSPGTLVDSGRVNPDYTFSEDLAAPANSPYGSIAVEVSTSRAEDAAGNEELWREQVASRVQQHRAKRKGSDPEPNLELRFPVQEVPVDPRIIRARRFVTQAATRSPFAEVSEMSSTSGVGAASAEATEPFVSGETPKLIHFPRSGRSSSASRSAMANVHEYYAAMAELEAETAQFASLRITDVAEESADRSSPVETAAGELHEAASADHPIAAYVPDDPPPIVVRKTKAPPAEQLELPNFDDIQLEATHQPVLPDLELGPQPAPLGQRMMAGGVDAAIVLAAAAVFNVTFSQLAEENLHSRMALLCAVAVGGVLWTLYQYTFLVHGNGTPGMYLANLELAKFNGKPASAFERRCRAVASALSGFSLGLGFLWALVDEDQLGWHDRMTKTLIRSGASQSAVVRETLW